ncbi:MAG: hypothetical protein R3E31_05100 [Chloroflexota bacterium]
MNYEKICAHPFYAHAGSLQAGNDDTATAVAVDTADLPATTPGR